MDKKAAAKLLVNLFLCLVLILVLTGSLVVFIILVWLIKMAVL